MQSPSPLRANSLIKTKPEAAEASRLFSVRLDVRRC